MKKLLVGFVVLSLLMGTTASAAATTYNTWVHTAQGMEDAISGYPDTNTLVFSPNYAADHTVYAGTYVGVYKSTDSGLTWTASSTGMVTKNDINSLAISPNYVTDHSLAAGTANGVYLSTDYGANWTDISIDSLPDKTIEVVAFDPRYNYSSFPDIFIATSTSGVYQNTARPWNWSALNTNLGDQRVLALAFTPGYAADTNGYLYAGVDNSYNDKGGVFRMKKGDTSWTELNNGLPSSNASDFVVDALAISPNFAADQTIYAGIWAGQGIYKSANGGASWNFLTGTEHLYIQTLALSPYYLCDHTIYAGEDGGAYVSKDRGATWSQMDNGFLVGKSIRSIIVAPGKPSPALVIFAGAGGDGVWQYTVAHDCVFMPYLKK